VRRTAIGFEHFHVAANYRRSLVNKRLDGIVIGPARFPGLKIFLKVPGLDMVVSILAGVCCIALELKTSIGVLGLDKVMSVIVDLDLIALKLAAAMTAVVIVSGTVVMQFQHMSVLATFFAVQAIVPVVIVRYRLTDCFDVISSLIAADLVFLIFIVVVVVSLIVIMRTQDVPVCSAFAAIKATGFVVIVRNWLIDCFHENADCVSMASRWRQSWQIHRRKWRREEFVDEAKTLFVG
jgi:hypothetical protein